ncbi:MAG TPA: nucleotide exchange factor GrpE [Methanoregulaceae archaeon]|nr:nucleotide exchange factor GrpE [Methanoregulaceae archaeon]
MSDMHEEVKETQIIENQGNNGSGSEGGTDESGAAPAEGTPDPELLKQQLADMNEKYLRLAADFENYRKRTDRDLSTNVRYAIEKFAVDLIDVIDNFDRALASDPSAAREGLEQINKLFRTIIASHGITPIDSVGIKFNPAEHEAVVCIPSDKEDGTVVEELCKGYRMHDRIIRCAKVAVAKGRESK